MIYKLGIDPTGNIHIGHIFLMNFIKKKIKKNDLLIIVIGDFTGNIKTKVKKIYIKRIYNIFSNFFKNINIKFFKNSIWLNLIKPKIIYKILRYIDFKNFLKIKYIKKNKNNLLDLLYPIFQSIDSLVIKPNFEFGGIDQISNFKITKIIQKKLNFNITKYIYCKLLKDKYGKKMSKTKNNCIYIFKDLRKILWNFLKINDNNCKYYFFKFNKIIKFFYLKIFCEKNIYLKIILFFNLLNKIVSKKKLLKVISLYKKKELNIKYLKLDKFKKNFNFLIEKKILYSKSHLKRLIKFGGIKVNGNKIIKNHLNFKKKALIKIGKKLLLNVLR
ncbi:hypothetical protein [Candidatus Vidania fulgoroideorum]